MSGLSDAAKRVPEWVGLTDEDRRLVRKWTTYNQYMTAAEYAEAVQIATEEALKEKNT